MDKSALNIVVPIVRKAGDIIRDYSARRTFKIEAKKDGSWVTAADRDVESFLVEEFSKAFQRCGYGFLTEESGIIGNQDECWIIDPLDGTTNFIHGFPNYAISVAFASNNIVQLGVVYDVCRDDIYMAVKGDGAMVNNRRIRVNKDVKMKNALISFSGSGMNLPRWQLNLIHEFFMNAAGIRRTGSAALDLALTAAARSDVVFGNSLAPWDVAAGFLLLREAGALLIDLDNNVDFQTKSNVDFFVGAAPSIFMEVKKMMNLYKNKI